MAKFIDINGLKTIIAKVYTDIKSKADKSYVDQSITNLNIDQKANKNEVPAQANFTYQINMVASDQQPSVETTGTYPDLVITFNIPQGAGGSTGGSDKPVDTGTPRMWYGWIPYDESGTAGFNTPEQIGSGMSKEIIQFGLNAGGLVESDPKGFASKLELGTVQADTFLCCIVPVASNIVAYYDNAGARVRWSTLSEDDYPFAAEGTIISAPINGVNYKIYGCYLTVGGLQYLWIVEE